MDEKEHYEYCQLHKTHEEDIKDVRANIGKLFLRNDVLKDEVEEKVPWNVLWRFVVGFSLFGMFILGSQVTVHTQSLTKSEFRGWKLEREDRLNRFNDNIMIEFQNMKGEIKELRQEVIALGKDKHRAK